eukprot:scaffold770_cov255-Pinguiococcus_pyrenoidosus.AAC.12
MPGTHRVCCFVALLLFLLRLLARFRPIRSGQKLDNPPLLGRKILLEGNGTISTIASKKPASPAVEVLTGTSSSTSKRPELLVLAQMWMSGFRRAGGCQSGHRSGGHLLDASEPPPPSSAVRRQFVPVFALRNI